MARSNTLPSVPRSLACPCPRCHRRSATTVGWPTGSRHTCVSRNRWVSIERRRRVTRMPGMVWEELLGRADVSLRRSGRFLVAELRGPHCVLSTSVCNGGQVDHVRFLLNHQSCEGAGHLDRHRLMTSGLAAYHDVACAEAGVP